MPSRRVTELALAATTALVASLVFTWPLAADPAGSLPSTADPLYNAWVLGWIADRTAHGLAGVWDAPIFYPYPGALRFVEPMLGIGVPLAPVYWLGHNAVLLHNVAVWASFVVAGTGGYVLGRDLTGRRAAGVVAAAIAAFVPYRLSHLVHVQVLMAAWLWWAAWALHQYFERPSLPRALRLVAFYCLLGLSSLYWAYIGLLPLGTIACVEVWRRRPPAGRALAHGLVAAAVCGAVFLPVVRPLASLTTSNSPVRGTVSAASYGADVLDYVSGAPTLRVWGSVLRPGAGETDLFPGLTAIVCALLALGAPLARSPAAARTGRGEWTWVYAGIGVAAIVLSFGPSPEYNGHVLFANPVFAWLHHVPGFAQMRVPSRFFVVAHLALSVLAACGVAVWLAAWRVSSIKAAALAGVLAVMVFAESLGAPVHVDEFWPFQGAGVRAVYSWLSRHPGGAVLELPLDGWGHRRYSLFYQFRTLLHPHPIVNGVGRFMPPLPAMLADPDSPLTEPSRMGDGVAFLRALGVRYVVVHRTWYERPSLGQAITDALVRAAGMSAVTFGESSIVDLGPMAGEETGAAVRELPASAMQIEASRGDVGRMLDGDAATRWMTTRPQSGTDWIEITLPSVTVTSGVRLQLGPRSLNDYPRGLEVSVSAAGGPQATVFTGTVMSAFGAALRLAPSAPSIELRWAPTPAQHLRLQQTGGRTRWYWSIHELRLLAPAS